MSLRSGTKLGRYEIRSKIGAGGMGEVYLAYDSQLQRSVALKILPAELAQDQQRMHRFVQEARSASALNHPNILTIYEVGNVDNLHFIATEFIDGENLREHLRNTRLRLGDLLDIAAQIASALAKAHSSGIIHRDIKPENIMVTHDGYVKVLDFGLSKLTEQRVNADPEAPTQAFINTEPGKIVGTTRYMSPEQARGLEIDPRSDIWSLGVVLYEALTGHAPFEGSTASDLIVSILEREPPPISRFNSEAPHQFDRIIRKALTKDREERYQVIKDFQIDLKNLKRELELEAEIDRTVPPEVRAALSTKASTQSGVETIHNPGVATAQTRPVQSVSSAEYLVSGIKRHKTMFAAGAGLIAFLAIGTYVFLANRGPALTDKDTILIADFTNTTGDNVFDGTLKQALAVQLGQSPYLSIAPDDRIRDTLRFMGRPPEERLTKDIARQISLRQGIKAVLAGSISSLGSNYVLTLEALNAQSGEAFAREQIETTRKEDVLKALGTITARLREKLGESLASIEKFDAPIEEATTASLEALQAFSKGDEKRASGKYDEAVPFYKRAIELDPNFALAYARLGVMYFNLRQLEKTSEYAERAFALRDRVSEREKLYISATYYQNSLGDFDKTIETLELWKQTYPRDYVPANNLGVAYGFLGQYEKQLATSREALNMNPNAASPYTNLGWSYLRLNRFDEAAQIFEQATAQDKVSFGLHSAMYVHGYLTDDANRMKQQVDWAAGKPFEPVALVWQASVAFKQGHFAQVRDLRKKAAELALSRNQKDIAARSHINAAVMEAMMGNCSTATVETNTAVGLSKAKEQLSVAAFVYAFCGDAARAEAILADLSSRFSQDTAIVSVFSPTVKAVLESKRNNPARALELLEPVRRYDIGEVANLFPTYIRGLTYLQLGRSQEAVAEFQKVLDHHPITFEHPLHTLAQLQLARAWARAAAPNAGDDSARASALAAARRAYQDFLAMWKDADPNPVLEQAKAEYAKLN